jgi:Ca-activated chloride channel family protein
LLLVLLPLAALAFRRGWISPLLLVLLVVPAPRQAAAMSWSDLWLRPDQRAAQLFEQGKTQAAADTFHDPDWRAAAAYRAGDYDRALQSLQGIDNPNTDYNRGNTFARLGQYQDAIDAYDQALATDPDDPDAKYNRELVQRLLDQQQQQQQDQSAAQDGQQGADSQDQSGQAQQSSNQPDKAAPQDDEQQDAAQASSDAKSDESTASAPADEPAGVQAESDTQQQQQHSASADNHEQTDQHGNEPGLADLLGAPDKTGKPAPTTQADIRSQPMTEDQQAMEHQLNRVPDDPAGLLRQRFLLQHLRRTGQL